MGQDAPQCCSSLACLGSHVLLCPHPRKQPYCRAECSVGISSIVMRAFAIDCPSRCMVVTITCLHVCLGLVGRHPPTSLSDPETPHVCQHPGATQATLCKGLLNAFGQNMSLPPQGS